MVSDDVRSTRVGPRMGYQPGLDGLRALSVVLVILYHAGVVRAAERPAGSVHHWFFDGGFLGVEVFFVVSGYLITSLLIEERATSGRIVLHRFWFRRFRRLLPALWVMIAAAGVWASLWGKDYLADLRWDSFFGLFYGANFQQLVGKVSYFGGFPHLLRHLWSLAVEEHFYLLFPPVFWLVLRKPATPMRRLLYVVIPAAVLSASLLVAIWARPVERLTDTGAQLDDTRQNWAYLSTFTRIGGILIGVALAVVWSPWKRAGTPAKGGGWRLDLAGLGAFALVVVAALTLKSESAALYRGGLTAVSLLSAVAIAAVVDPRTRVMHAVFANKVAAAIGRRSYGLYLWHWPIFVGPLNGRPIWERLVVGGAATVVCSELCYRFVETPIRQGALGRWFRAVDHSIKQRRGRTRYALPTIMCAAGFSLLIGALVLRLKTVDEGGLEVRGAGAAEVFDQQAALDAITAPPTSTIAGAASVAPSDSSSPTSASSTGPSSTRPSSSSGTASRTTAGPTTTASTELVPPPIPVPATPPKLPRRLVILGDSTGNSLFHNLPDGLASTFTTTNGSLQGCGVYDDGKLLTAYPGWSTRFKRCLGWQAKWAAAANEARAEVALVMLGAWDVFDLQLDGGTLSFGTPEWDAYWLRNLKSGLAAVERVGTNIALLEVACMRPQDVKGQGVPPLPERGDDSRVAHVNRLLIQAAIDDPEHVFFVRGPRQWCTDERISRDLFYRWDGVHASRKGGKLILEAIAPELLSIPPGAVTGSAQQPG